MPRARWSADEAWRWYRNFGWLLGCNFIPSNAVNQIEMWGEKTFDPVTIRRELSWARDTGFNSVRVFLHDVAWASDRKGFIARFHEFLDIAAKLKLSTIPVIFDDCWHTDPATGIQQPPIPGKHNSRWVQSPGIQTVRDESTWAAIEIYVKEIVSEFSHDKRIVMWDLYNEVGNYFLPSLSKAQPLKALSLAAIFIAKKIQPDKSLQLLKKSFEWARSCNPSQPLTSPIWFNDTKLNNFLDNECDIITFHNYKNAANLESQITQLKASGRPVVCTEYMARTSDSLFETHLPVFRRDGVGCYSWGVVAGKTQTNFPWKSKKDSPEPAVWFHDIFHIDGSPWRVEEIDSIKTAAGRKK